VAFDSCEWCVIGSFATVSVILWSFSVMLCVR
jgi:hypothetical protein